MSHNLVYDLNGTFFIELKNLNELILGFNQIEEISKENFQGLDKLDFIDLSQNKIFSFGQDLFFFLRNVKKLKLSSNRLRFFNESLETLEYLDLSFNNLTKINLSFLTSLNFLDLSHNVKLVALNFTENVKVLNLSNRNSELILNFSTSSKLEEIDLSFNDLKLLNENFFSNAKYLIKLNLKNSKFQSFNLFNSFPKKLKEIDYSYNQLIGEELAFFKLFKDIEILRISKGGGLYHTT